MSACREDISVSAGASLHIRPMQARDIMRVWAIEKDIYDFPWSCDTFRVCSGEGYVGQVIELYRRIVGYGILQVFDEDCHMLNLGIESWFRRHGLGSDLLGSMLDAVKLQGTKRAFLEVRPSNQAARALYAKENFIEIGLRKDYYPTSVGREDALVLARLL